MRLETEIRLEVLGDLTNQTLERKLADEKLSALLVLADLTQGDSAGPARRTIQYISLNFLSIKSTSDHDITWGQDREGADLKRCGFFTPPVDGADFLAALDASCLRGACTNEIEKVRSICRPSYTKAAPRKQGMFQTAELSLSCLPVPIRDASNRQAKPCHLSNSLGTYCARRWGGRHHLSSRGLASGLLGTCHESIWVGFPGRA
jgi:hypothetical protein